MVPDSGIDGDGDTRPARKLRRTGAPDLAYRYTDGASPTVVFFGGFASNMDGIKARFLERCCVSRGRSFLRFDYSGHGDSEGDFETGTIGAWCEDACAITGAVTQGPLLLAGSSMGAWLMVLAAQRMPERVRAMMGIAAAPDFTEDLIWERMTSAEQAAFSRDGSMEMGSRYQDDPHIIPHAFVVEARQHLILRAPVALSCPVHLLHGTSDLDVPSGLSARLLERLHSKRAWLTLIKDGDHRLSADHELAEIERCLDHLLVLSEEADG